MAHRLRQLEDVALQRKIQVLGKALPHNMCASHARHSGGNERFVKEQPGRLAAQRLAGTALAGEQPILRARFAAGLDPFSQRHGRFGVDDDGTARHFAFAVLPVEVDARADGGAIPNLADVEAQELADPQAGSDAEYEQGAVAPAVAAFEVPQGETKFFRGEGWAAFHAPDNGPRSSRSFVLSVAFLPLRTVSAAVLKEEISSAEELVNIGEERLLAVERHKFDFGPQIFEAAFYLDEAMCAHKTGRADLAKELIRRADMPII